MNKTPYNFAQGNPAGSLAQRVAGFIAGGLNQRAGVQEKLMEHNMRLREMKKQSKQDRKTIKASAQAEQETHGVKTQNMVSAASQISRKVAEPGTKFDLSPDRVSATAKRPKPKKEAAAPVAAPAPAPAAARKKPKMRPSMGGKTY